MQRLRAGGDESAKGGVASEAELERAIVGAKLIQANFGSKDKEQNRNAQAISKSIDRR